MSDVRRSSRFLERESKKPKLETMTFLEQPKFISNPENREPAETPKPKRGRGRPRRQAAEPLGAVQSQLADVATFIAEADTTAVNQNVLPIEMVKRHIPSDHYGRMIDDMNISGLKEPPPRVASSKPAPVSNLLAYIDDDDSEVECLDDQTIEDGRDDKNCPENPFTKIRRELKGEDLESEAERNKYQFKSLWQYRLPDLNSTEEPWKLNVAKPGFVPDVLSIVASMFVGQRLDLKEIALKARNIEYNPDRFAPLIMRVRNPKSTSLIFSSGKMIVTGTRSEAECKLAARKYARVLQRMGYKRIKVLNFEIQNISASTNLKFHVRLRNLAQDENYKGVVSYEPEMFPGLVYPLECPKVKSIIFCSGAVLMTGARSEEELKTALETIYPAAKMYGH